MPLGHDENIYEEKIFPCINCEKEYPLSELEDNDGYCDKCQEFLEEEKQNQDVKEA